MNYLFNKLDFGIEWGLQNFIWPWVADAFATPLRLQSLLLPYHSLSPPIKNTILLAFHPTSLIYYEFAQPTRTEHARNPFNSFQAYRKIACVGNPRARTNLHFKAWDFSHLQFTSMGAKKIIIRSREWSCCCWEVSVRSSPLQRNSFYWNYLSLETHIQNQLLCSLPIKYFSYEMEKICIFGGGTPCANKSHIRIFL